MNNEFIISNLGESPEYYKDVITLIENEFKYESGFHYDEDFKNLLEPINHKNCLIVINRKNNELAAHLGFIKKNLIKENNLLPVVFLGGIATERKYRGKNLFRTLMNKALTLNSDSALFALWSDISGLYEKFYFYQAGGLIETGKNIITSDNIPDGYLRTKFNLLKENELNEIITLYNDCIQKNHFTIVRKNLDWSIIKTRNTSDLYLKKMNGKIVSYFVVGKGKDLPNTIHEFAATNANELKVIQQFKVWLPEYHLSNFPNHTLFYTAFFKIGNVNNLSNFLKKIILHFEIIKHEKNEITFLFEGKEHKCPENEFIKYIFGPYPLEEFKQYKLSPYISGLDSV